MANDDKKTKDVDQATVLFAILAEREPGALEEAMKALPRAARRMTISAAKIVLARLDEAGHERAAALLRDLLG